MSVLLFQLQAITLQVVGKINDPTDVDVVCEEVITLYDEALIEPPSKEEVVEAIKFLEQSRMVARFSDGGVMPDMRGVEILRSLNAADRRLNG